jgi:formylglycine-generating enzyme required for sulfatase activity
MKNGLKTRFLALGVAFSLVAGVLGADEKSALPTTTDKVRIPQSIVEFTLVKLPAGKISLKDKDGKAKEYDIKPIWIGQTEVTWDTYEIFFQRTDLTDAQNKVGFDAQNRPSKPYIPPDRGWGAKGSPAGSLFCSAAKKYCEWLSKKTGHKYRLPTEAEWEYACRAGGPEVKPSKAELREKAWYEGNSEDQTHPVAKKKPNAWGLYDMLGNVAEWVTTMEGQEAACGGSYQDAAEDISSSTREVYKLKLQKNDSQIPKGSSWLSDGAHLGFRVVRED